MTQRAFQLDHKLDVVSTTYTRIGNRRWDILLGAVLLSEETVRPADFVDLTAADRKQQLVKFRRKNFSFNPLEATAVPQVERGACVSHVASRPLVEQLSVFTDDQPIELGKSWKCAYQLWQTAPVLADGTVLLGELDKWVHVSPQRVLKLREKPFPVVTIDAVEGEAVTIYFTHVDDLDTIYASTCVAQSDGSMEVVLKRPNH